MKLLLFTQKVDKNDDVLGFFHRWLVEFAKYAETVIVVCLEEGVHDLPSNMEVVSLGKENGVGKIGYLRTFFKIITKRVNDYDSVFIHMNPIYGVLGGWYFRLKKKRVMMWYTHRQVDLKLRIATFFSHVVFTASDYSFRLKTKKKKVVGHGIEVELFDCPNRLEGNTFDIVTVGRITRIKRIDKLLYVLDSIREVLGKKVTLTIVGDVVTGEDRKYKKELLNIVNSLSLNDLVTFVGSVPHDDIQRFYCKASVVVNLCPDGGIDKVVLEAMASKVPVVVSNEAFREYFGKYADDLIITDEQTSTIAEKIVRVGGREDENEMLGYLRNVTEEYFDVTQVVKKIVDTYETSR